MEKSKSRMRKIGPRLLMMTIALAAISACVSSGASVTGGSGQGSGSGYAPAGQGVKSDIVSLTNAYRGTKGLGGYRRNPALDRAAQAHADDMARNGFFSHTGSNGSSSFQRVKAAGYNACLAAENIAWGQKDAQSVVTGWINSAGHRRNIENRRAVDMGVGYVPAGNGTRAQYVQVFARPC